MNKQYWPRSEALAKSKWGNLGASALRGWRHALLRRALGGLGCCPWPWICTDGLLHHVRQEGSGTLGGKLTMRTAAADIHREGRHSHLWARSPATISWAMCWGPRRGCVEALLLGISRKRNDKYSCSLLQIPCISHANGVSFPGDTDPS